MKTEIKKTEDFTGGAIGKPPASIDSIAQRRNEGYGSIMKTAPYSREELGGVRKLAGKMMVEGKHGEAADIFKEAGLEKEMKEAALMIIDGLRKSGRHGTIADVAKKYGLENEMKEAAKTEARKIAKEAESIAGEYRDDIVLLFGTMRLYGMMEKLVEAASYAKKFGIGEEMADLAEKLVETSVLSDMTDATHYLAEPTMANREVCLQNAYMRGAYGLGLGEKEIYSIIDKVFESRKGEVFERNAELATRQFDHPEQPGRENTPYMNVTAWGPS